MADILNTLLLNILLSSILISAVLLIKLIFRKSIGIKALSFLWILVVFRLIMPFTLQSPIHLEGISVLNHTISYETPTVVDYETPDDLAENTPLEADGEIKNIEEYENQVQQVNRVNVLDKITEYIKSLELKTITVFIWLIVAVYIVFKNFSFLIWFNCNLRKSNNISRKLKSAFETARVKSCINKAMIIECENIDIPITYGLLNPKILIPKDLVNNIDENKLTLILMHELTHIKHGDILKNYLWLIAKAIHWFNPLVWIAYKVYLSDMELVCDARTTDSLENNQRVEYSESLLEATKLLIPDKKSSFVMLSFCETKTQLRRRIMNILEPKKQNNTSTAVIVILCIIMIIGCFTTACVSISGNSQSNDIMTPASENQVIDCPDNYSDSFESKDGKVSITIDAEIFAPDVDKFPVMEIDPQPVTKDLMQQMVDYFMEGDTGEYPVWYMTTEQIEERLAQYELKLNDESVLVNEYTENFGEDVQIDYDKVREAIKDRIAEYTAMLETAPETRETVPCDLHLHPDYFYTMDDYGYRLQELKLTDEQLTERENRLDENLYLVSDATISNGDNIRMIVYREPGTVGGSFHNAEHYEVQVIRARNDFLYENRPLTSAHPLNDISYVENFDAPYPNLTISQNEALEMAQKVLDDIGADNFYLAYSRIRKEYPLVSQLGEDYDSENADDKFYMFTFKSVFVDIPMIIANNRFNTSGQWAMGYSFEEITMKVSNDEVVEFRWVNPMQTSTVVNENASLMDFDEIMKIAKKYMKQSYTIENVALVWDESETYEEDLANYISADIEIAEIKLGLAGTFNYDNLEEYMIVPVWSFYGRAGWETKDNSLPKIEDETEGDVSYEPILSINAVDGSIIKQYQYIDLN